MPEIPRHLLGPTGKVFFHSRGYSTELNITLEDDEGKFYNTPLLVPGQQDVDKLLAGERPSDEQIRRAADWAKRSGIGAKFSTPEEAVNFAGQRHDRLEQQLMPYLRPHLKRRGLLP